MEVSLLQVGMMLATCVLALVGVVTATAAYLTYRVNIDPHVIVYTRHDDDRPTLIELVIENIGKGVAHDVWFEPGSCIA